MKLSSQSIHDVSKQANKLENQLDTLTEKLGEINQPVWNELDRFGIIDEAYLPPQSKGAHK